MTQLNLNDVNNLLRLVSRSEFHGLEEAEVGVYLKHKLMQLGQELASPKQDEEEPEE